MKLIYLICFGPYDFFGFGQVLDIFLVLNSKSGGIFFSKIMPAFSPVWQSFENLKFKKVSDLHLITLKVRQHHGDASDGDREPGRLRLFCLGRALGVLPLDAEAYRGRCRTSSVHKYRLQIFLRPFLSDNIFLIDLKLSLKKSRV